MIETCTLGKDELQYEQIAKEHKDGGPNPFIHEHLATLYFIAKAFDCADVLEIGTGNGASTIAFIEAGCHVTTLDIKDQEGVKTWLKSWINQTTFVKLDSLKYPIDHAFDIIFIDGLHTWEQVKQELERFSPHADFLILHDITNPAHGGVNQAVKEFRRNHSEFDYYQWFNCNGLAVLKRRE